MSNQSDIRELSDEALLSAVAARRSEALAELYSRFAPRMLGLIATILRDRHAANDVLQESMLSLWTSAAAGFDPALGSAQSWVLRVARSRAIDALRRAGRRPEETLPEEAKWPVSSAGGVGGGHGSAELRLAIDALPDEERRPLVLAYAFGYSREHIAEHLGSPVGTVKTRIRRATARLRELIGPSSGGSAPAMGGPGGGA